MDDDTGLSELRAEFVATFDERKRELDERLAEFVRLRKEGRDKPAREAFLAIHVIVHKLAGAAGTYGLFALGSLVEALDDLLSPELAENRTSPELLARLPERGAVVSRALGEAYAAKGDSPKVASSPEGKKLISDAGSLPSEASS